MSAISVHAEHAFSLLSLPAGLVASCVWPHLGPWSRAQLRASCRELRGVADALLPNTLNCMCEVQPTHHHHQTSSVTVDTTGATHHPEQEPQHIDTRPEGLPQQPSPSTPAHPSLVAVHSLLFRAPGAITTLRLACSCSYPYAEPSSSTLPHPDTAIGPTLLQLGTASGGRLSHLSLVYHSTLAPCPQGAMSAVGAAFPALKSLEVVCVDGEVLAQPQQWAQALHTLPPTLTSLAWVCWDESMSMNTIPSLLAATTVLRNLTSLSLTSRGELDPQHLVPMAHHLTHLTLDGVGASHQLAPMLRACAARLRSLSMRTPDMSSSLSDLLAPLASLRHLTLLYGSGMSDPEAVVGGLAAATQLRTVRVVEGMVMLRLCRMARDRVLAPGALSHLTQLEAFVPAVSLDRLLASGVLHPQCALVVDTRLNLVGGAQDAALAARCNAAVTRHGISLRLHTRAPVLAGVWGVGVHNDKALTEADDQVAVSAAVSAMLHGLHGLCPSGRLVEAMVHAAEGAGAGRDMAAAAAGVPPSPPSLQAASQGGDGVQVAANRMQRAPGCHAAGAGRRLDWLCAAVAGVRVLAVDATLCKALLSALPTLLASGWLPQLTEVHANCAGLMRVEGGGREPETVAAGDALAPLFVNIARVAPAVTVWLYVEADGESRVREMLRVARPQLKGPDQLRLVHV